MSIDVTQLMNTLIPLISLVLVVSIMMGIVKEFKGVGGMGG